MMAICLFSTVFAGVANCADKYDLFPITENDLLAGKTVFIDPGHGKGNANGAGDYLEHEGNLIEALLLKENLERCGATVVMTRPTETDVDSYARMSIVNKYALEKIREQYIERRDNAGSTSERDRLQNNIDELTRLISILQSIIDKPSNSSDYYTYRLGTISNTLRRVFEYEDCDLVRDNMLFISIHANANGSGGNDSANGTETYYLNNSKTEYYSNYSYVSENRTFAGYLLEEIVASGNFKDRGVKVGNYFMIRELNIPAALAEVAFFTNASDRAKLLDETYQKRIAAAMTYAVMKHFDAYVDPTTISEITYKMGDVNRDGKVDNADLILVARYVVKITDYIDFRYADLNGDGDITNVDIIRLAKLLVNLDD
jgi:N-acetylmuramoyl-L-alanine amidase